MRAGVRCVDLIAIDDRIRAAAGILEPRVLRTLDALHLATALAASDDLDELVTYDERMIEAARLVGLLTPCGDTGLLTPACGVGSLTLDHLERRGVPDR